MAELKLGHDDQTMNANLLALLQDGCDWGNAVATTLQLSGRNRSEFDHYLTEDMPNRLLFAVGIFNGTTVTLEDLKSIVSAYEEGFLIPTVTITHKEEEEHEEDCVLYQFPFKFGEVRNLRIVDDKFLYGDMVKVPRKIVRLVKAGLLPTLSVEIWRNLPAPNIAPNKIYPYVLDSVALLGSDRPALWEVMEAYHLAGSEKKDKIAFKKSTEQGEKIIFHYKKEKKGDLQMNEDEKKSAFANVMQSLSKLIGIDTTSVNNTTSVKPADLTPAPEVTPTTTVSFAANEPKQSFSLQDVQKIVEDNTKKMTEAFNAQLESKLENFNKVIEQNSAKADEVRVANLNRQAKLPVGLNSDVLAFAKHLEKAESYTQNLKFSIENKEVPMKEAFLQFLEKFPENKEVSTDLTTGSGPKQFQQQDYQKFGALGSNPQVDELLSFKAWCKDKSIDISTSSKIIEAKRKYHAETGILLGGQN